MATSTSHSSGLAPLLAGLAMFGPFSIDTIFPAFPEIMLQFKTNALAMQQTLSVYLVAYAIMALLHGPLSDSFGRRSIILYGVAVFTVASVGCALSQSISMLLAFRALQGFSAGAGLIVGRAIVRDCYHGAAAQRLMSQITLIFGIAPALAPIVGGLVLQVANWQVIFWLIAVFAALLWVLCWVWLPETHAVENRVGFSAASIYSTYRNIVYDAYFLCLSIAATANFAALFLYISVAPTFVLNLLHLGQQQFAWLFIPAISGMMLGAYLSGRLAGRISAAQTVGMGYAIMFVAGIANVALNFILSAPILPWSVLPIGVCGIGIALTFPTLTLLVLDRFPHHRGAASSAQAFISLSFNALLSGVIAAQFSSNMLHLAVGALGFTVCGYLAWCWHQRMGRRATLCELGVCDRA